MDLSLSRQSLSKAITAFALDLYNSLNSSKLCKNVFFSPASISTALSMVLMGASGNSKMQIEKVLHLAQIPGEAGPLDSERKVAQLVSESMRQDISLPAEGTICSEFKQLLLQLNNLSHGYQLKLANNLFMQKGYQFLQQYLTNTKEIYNATLQIVDFYSAAEETRKTINLEIYKQTQGNIKELFAPGVIGPQTVLVLANAIYLKATWQHQFDPKYTTERNFRLNENETKSVHMMYQKRIFKLGHTDGKNARILCLPYVGELLSMFIILPNDIHHLEQVEAAMTCKNLTSWLSPGNLREQHAEIYIPRFKLEAGYDLNLMLQGLGLIDVFSEAKADLLGMSFSRQLFLSTVVHKAYVDVNEVGTEAAAATGVAVSNRSLEHYELFLADHPFLFCILHNPTGTILFLGKLCCP
ncbi:leukocyte elastase inhibitor-like [Crotalus tigris]|uniref:leukocyte elastase inhibitor-like n=1 Tax=Crotalus tigris TaxID=88082 RepID=UPI00192FA121|nr:leukocyte elastase inhibitor-like [Crotalus tigris]